MVKSLILLFRSRKFLLLLVALAQTILFHFLPDFPDALWQSINAVIVAVIMGIAIEDGAAKFGRSDSK